ncbi:lipid asymmetry maintenance protein MlaB [Moritella sp. Urea-trap-13]|uniref:STAS domain-containing protein n=1 Tax=Moritella sp. Urea-trap-13 TaxID=2058327 RepID=UPI000C325AA4|nr:STAS domain-containing protein [Moritella sp. Urea-trap-13]PKH07847.1 anti-sigma B factor antagonist [Moritella sp. Urea-trap-13]
MNTESEKHTVLTPENLTIYEALEIQVLFATALTQHQKIEVNLSQVTEIDCAGLQLMVALKRDALKQKKSMIYTAHSREVIALLALFNMTQFFGDPVVL